MLSLKLYAAIIITLVAGLTASFLAKEEMPAFIGLGIVAAMGVMVGMLISDLLDKIVD